MLKFEEELKRFQPLPEGEGDGVKLSGDLSKDLSIILEMLEKDAEESRHGSDQLGLEDVH